MANAVTLRSIRNQGNLTMKFTIDKVTPPEGAVLLWYVIVIDGSYATAFTDPATPVEGVDTASLEPNGRLTYILDGFEYETGQNLGVAALFQIDAEDPFYGDTSNIIRKVLGPAPDEDTDPTEAEREALRSGVIG